MCVCLCVCVCLSPSIGCDRLLKQLFFFGLMFKRQQNDSAYGKSVTVNDRVLLL